MKFKDGITFLVLTFTLSAFQCLKDSLSSEKWYVIAILAIVLYFIESAIGTIVRIFCEIDDGVEGHLVKTVNFYLFFLWTNFEFQTFEICVFIRSVYLAMMQPSFWFIFCLVIYIMTTVFIIFSIIGRFTRQWNIFFQILDECHVPVTKLPLKNLVKLLQQFSVLALGEIAPDSIKMLWQLLFEEVGSSWLLGLPRIKNIVTMIRQQEAYILPPSVGILLMLSVCFRTFLFQIEPFLGNIAEKNNWRTFFFQFRKSF